MSCPTPVSRSRPGLAGRYALLTSIVLLTCLVPGRVGAQVAQTAFRTDVAFANLTFDQPVGFATAPSETDRIFIVEKPGRIQAVTGLNSSTRVKQLFLDLTSVVAADDEGGLLGLAFHPSFATNHYFYVFYTTNTTTAAGTGFHDRVSRFTALPASATNADILATEMPMISQYDEATNHNGGDIHFGADGYLYVAVGDEGGANDQYGNSQRIDGDFFSGVLRLDVDQRTVNLVPNPHPAVHPNTYRVPADNPYVGATTFNGVTLPVLTAIRTELWAVGLRNPWRFSFDGPTGRLFLGDVGQSAREEIDLVTRGGNYGWAYREGTMAGPRSNPPAGATFIAPIWEADRSLAGSITGGVVYHGSTLSDLTGRYIFGDYLMNHIFSMTVPLSGPVQVETLFDENTPVAFGIDPHNGDVLIASFAQNAIRRLVSTNGPATFQPPPTTTPPVTTPPTTTPPVTTPPPTNNPANPVYPDPLVPGATGGGAASPWFLAAVGALALFRRACRRT